MGKGLGLKMPPVFHGSCPGPLGHESPSFAWYVSMPLVDLSERRKMKTKKIRLGILCCRAGAGRVEKAVWGPHSSSRTCYMRDGRMAPTLPWTVTQRPDKAMEKVLEHFNYR